MKILFVRHGEPCYVGVLENELVSYLGELSPCGIIQAEKVSKSEKIADSEIIISSPFTRALQTAAIISKNTGISIIVEPAIHEWLADMSHTQTLDQAYGKNSYHEFLNHNGERTRDCIYNWESASHIASRAYPAMKKYLHYYNKVIVVAHAMLIRAFGYDKQDLHNCSIYEKEFDENSEYTGFVPWNGKESVIKS